MQVCPEFSKDFLTVTHSILIQKLCKHGGQKANEVGAKLDESPAG